MYGLSVASGAIAVVSLAAQIGSGIKKLCDFWDSVQDSPKEVRTIIKQLNIISHIVNDIREGASAPQPYSRALTSTHAALDSCAESIETLEEMVAESQSRLASRKKSRRTWAAIKIAWNGDRLKKYQHVLGEMKSTLILATQHSTSMPNQSSWYVYLLISGSQSQQQTLATITQGVAALLQQRSQDTTTSVSTDSRDIADHLKALKMECRKAAAGIGNPVARFGFENMMDKPLTQLSSGLDATSHLDGTSPADSYLNGDTASTMPRSPSASQYRRTQTYRSKSSSFFGTLYVVPKATLPAELNHSDDEVEEIIPEHFQTTMKFHPSQWLLRFGGDNKAIQRLFDSGQASPWDRDSYGKAPLFHAASYGNSVTCRFLLTQGADIEAKGISGRKVP
ncbi:hypothetical protein IFR04_010034 [Cadophora malorum]|uniref:Azaphilone pigments biosynthesis cluster protein L N-terminal domain-containing protein n=1 Tax=Cadophora malorum TaxID=108018 RepID=A0A8H7TDI9_9HELO|nr:hypothetical protein IFR04_010034 [Cadophora malorum]